VTLQGTDGMDIAAWPCGLSLLGGFRTPASHSASFIRRWRPEPFTKGEDRVSGRLGVPVA
jgi:hypothetical protein